MTAPEFVKAIDVAKGVCVLPLGSLEKHGDHIPIGTDSFLIRQKVLLASKIEPVVVFPVVMFTENCEAKNNPGAIALETNLYFQLLEGICDEIARNGFKKIILVTGHGGNRFFLRFFVQTILGKGKDYAVYFPEIEMLVDPDVEEKTVETKFDYHAGENETSQMLYLHPELVKKDAIPAKPGKPLNRSKVPGIMTPVYWMADFPEHYAGDARRATPEKGKILVENAVKNLVEIIRKVKADDVTLALLREYQEKSKSGGRSL
jgi:creatinine amidohydrolase